MSVSPCLRWDSSMNAQSFIDPSTVLLPVVLIAASAMSASSAAITVSESPMARTAPAWRLR